MTDHTTAAHAAMQESERVTAADEYFKARTWIMDTNDNRRIFEAGFDRAYALLSKLRAPVASAEVMDALNWVDDFIARCNRDDRGSCESVNVLRRALASAPVADERQPSGNAGELPDAVRVPLDSLHADAGYLVGRALDHSLSRAEVVSVIRSRIDAARAAIAALASAPVAKTVTKQDALNRFDFLEGAVDQQTYEQIADAALDLCASAPVAVPAECTNKLVSAHYRRGWNACRAEILRSESAPVAGEAMTDLIEDLSDLASDMAYEANQEMDQEKATRAALIERGERALRRIADAAPQASKPHEVAALVSRLWNIAEKYHGTQQLRDRISHEILPLLDLQASEAVRDAALDELGRRVVNRAVAGCLMVRDIQAIVADLKAQSTALSAQPGAQKKGGSDA